jgi:CBS domain containing-hemolysin-like protein
LLAVALVVALLVLVNALYVAAEFATVSARRTRINQMAAEGNRLARKLLPVIRNSQALDRYVAACQIGITASSLLLGAYGQNILADRLATLLTGIGNLAVPAAHSLAVTSMLLLLTGIQMVLGELIPKSIAIQYPERLALATVLPMRWSLRLFQPLIWLLNGSGNLLLRALRINVSETHTGAHSPEEIELLAADSQEGGLLTPDARHMLRNALRLRDLTARQIMTPRSRIVAAPENISVSDLLPICSQTGFSRIPIYRDNMDQIIGFVHIKDLLRSRVRGYDTTAEILRTATYISVTMPVIDIWEKLASQRQYIALVSDTHNCIAGLITYEDLIEQVFGELQDEFDTDTGTPDNDRIGHTGLVQTVSDPEHFYRKHHG